MSSNRSRPRQLLISALTYLAIIAVTLVVADFACIALGLFPPTPQYGDPQLGWRPADSTGHMALGRCLDVQTGKTVDYQRNEDGVRTDLHRDEILADSGIKIGVIGDSQTELCAPNSQLHSGVLQSELTARGIHTITLPYGAGKYSPLQAYLAFRQVLLPYHPQVLVMNLYTGNDFYDILRLDDRPHMVATASGYRVAPPVWYSLDDPSVHYRSRVLYAARLLAEKIGVRRLYLRVTELRRVAAQQGAGLPTVTHYIYDLWRARDPSVGYPDAFTSQMLNQQIFFFRFPPSQEESIRRIRALMAMIRQENPGVVLVMSPLPSYQLVARQPVDSELLRTVRKLDISYEDGIRQEGELYERLRGLAREEGWLFVDNLVPLHAYQGASRLYNDYDYHLLPAASALIGQAQAAVLADTLKRLTRGKASARPAQARPSSSR